MTGIVERHYGCDESEYEASRIRALARAFGIKCGLGQQRAAMTMLAPGHYVIPFDGLVGEPVVFDLGDGQHRHESAPTMQDIGADSAAGAFAIPGYQTLLDAIAGSMADGEARAVLIPSGATDDILAALAADLSGEDDDSGGDNSVEYVSQQASDEADDWHDVGAETYGLFGPDGGQIAKNLRTYAFAASAALRWSRTLGVPVVMMRVLDSTDNGDGTEAVSYGSAEEIDAAAMTNDEFATAMSAIDIARVENAVDELENIYEDVFQAWQDAQETLAGLQSLDRGSFVSSATLAAAARDAAEELEQTYWSVLIDASTDHDMAAELDTENGAD